MKLFRYYIILEVIFLFSCSGNEKVTEYYDNGKIKIEGTVVNGLQEGETIEYYSNGVVKSKGTFVNGKPHGTILSFDQEGHLVEKAHWAKGKLQGEVILFYKSGKPHITVNYFNGKFSGEKKEFNQDGKLIYIAHYKDNLLTGKEIFYDFKKGIIRENRYDENGQIYYFAFYNNEKKKIRSGIFPLFKTKSDTISLGQNYKVDIKLPLRLKGKTFILLTDSADKKDHQYDTLMSSTNQYFTYTINPTKVGKHKLKGIFKHLKNVSDTTTVDSLNIAHSYFVSPS